MGIGPIVRRLLAKDKVDPKRGDTPVPWRYVLGPSGYQYYRDSRGQVYYVDDDGEHHGVWNPPWDENPS